MEKYKIQTTDGDIEFELLSAESSDSYFQTLLRDNNPYLEEYIFHTITNNKYIDSDLSAGIVPTVVYAAMKLSGVVKGKYDFLNLIDSTRVNQEKNSYYSIYSKIIEVMPAYKLEELRGLSLNRIVELLVFAERIAGKQFTDTKKARDIIAKEEEAALGLAPQKKGIKGLTKMDLEAIKNAINYNDQSNMI